MKIFKSKNTDQQNDQQASQGVAPMDRFIAESDAAIDESNNEYAARKANEQNRND